MAKQTQQQIPRQEIMKQLFDGLMIQIEPDLTHENRKATAKKLAAMSEEERQEVFNGYQKAYVAFRESWPEYLKIVMKNMNGIQQSIEDGIEQSEEKEMQSLEDQISSSPEAS
ncbi:hypothetical protein KKF55_05670 [Patescibacteria group bacterium]|nr:hypothetical protein [Patescibacteria group bacterium]